MNQRRHKFPMSNDVRIAILETHMSNIQSTVVAIREDTQTLRQEMKASTDALRQEMKASRDAFRQEMKDLSDRMDQRFSVINNRLWSNFMWLMGLIIGLSGLMAHGFHWI